MEGAASAGGLGRRRAPGCRLNASQNEPGAIPPVPATSAWRVLVVDDDPCVLDVTQMTLEGMTVDGNPLSLTLLASASDALGALGQQTFALVIVDVVMETQRAGLELVEALRADRRHALTQIVVRTGEPAACPEAVVVSDFEINDYWPKTEMRASRMRASIAGLIRAHATALRLDQQRRASDALLHEVHHRVRNNLQVLLGLIELQKREADKTTERQLGLLASRVRSMALVHQQLHASDQADAIDFVDYLRQLARESTAAFGGEVRIEHRGETPAISLEAAVPAGILVNELFVEALARANGDHVHAPKVEVDLECRPRVIRLRVRANVPSPPEASPSDGRLGRKLIRALALQLGATVLHEEGSPETIVELPAKTSGTTI